MKSLNYRSLACLGVMKIDDSTLLSMQKDKEEIRLAFLRDFLQLGADISTLEEKNRILTENNINMFTGGSTYTSEKARILNEIIDTVNLHK